MTVRRYPLSAGREVRTTEARGLFIVAIHDADRVASLSVRPVELATFRAALAELAGRKARRPPRAEPT